MRPRTCLLFADRGDLCCSAGVVTVVAAVVVVVFLVACVSSLAINQSINQSTNQPTSLIARRANTAAPHRHRSQPNTTTTTTKQPPRPVVPCSQQQPRLPRTHQGSCCTARLARQHTHRHTPRQTDRPTGRQLDRDPRQRAVDTRRRLTDLGGGVSRAPTSCESSRPFLLRRRALSVPLSHPPHYNKRHEAVPFVGGRGPGKRLLQLHHHHRTRSRLSCSRQRRSHLAARPSRPTALAALAASALFTSPHLPRLSTLHMGGPSPTGHDRHNQHPSCLLSRPPSPTYSTNHHHHRLRGLPCHPSQLPVFATPCADPIPSLCSIHWRVLLSRQYRFFRRGIFLIAPTH